MSTNQGADIQGIYDRIAQLERRSTMDWYHKDQLFQDLFELKETIHMLSRKNEEIKRYVEDYYQKIDKLIDQLV